MNKLVVAFGLFALTFFFGLGVTVVQLVTDSFFFPLDMGGGFDADELMDVFDSGSQDEDLYDYGAIQEEMDYTEMVADSTSAVDIAVTESGESVGNWDCGDGNSIDAAWLNDGECDCYNCADEDNLFRCSNGDIINAAYLNDGDCDCGSTCDDES
jgi:hypothetical protein